MNYNLNYEPLLLICGSRSTENALLEQLRGFLPKEVPIIPFFFYEGKDKPEGNYFSVFSSQEVYDDFLKAGFRPLIKEYIITNRTMFNNQLDTILTLPRNQRILLVNDSPVSALESIDHLKDIGFDFLHLVPYYPGCQSVPKDISIAITPGEVDKVPPGIDAVYNIGTRVMDFPTVVKIMSHYGVLEQKTQDYANLYLANILDFAKRVSNIADEASKVMKTVRRELIGTGYYAKYRFDDIIGESENIQKTKVISQKIARTDLTVLIEGDNGTGKELFASAIHNASQRVRQPFVAINFSALPDHLLESELFGYEEGSFTGAKKGGKVGLFQQANGGTIFLDEIGDISIKMQAKLLRVIEEREIMKIGGDRIIPIDVRIIAATNRDLKQMIYEKTFRKDLYYRLREGYIHLPSLKERKTDIPLLVRHWQSHLFSDPKTIDHEVMEILMGHDWPGNIRELLNVIKFAFAVSERDVITKEDLPADSFECPQPISACAPALHMDEIALLVLSAIWEINLKGDIAGRGSILRFLKEQPHHVSEYKIRKGISTLLSRNLIANHQGKYGLTLTEKGFACLYSDFDSN